MKIAIFHDDFQVFGGAEKTMVILAEHLKADIITFSISEEVKKLIPKKINVKVLTNKKIKDLENSARRYYFSKINLAKEYDFFIFCRAFCICASKKHKPNLFYISYLPNGYKSNKDNLSEFNEGFVPYSNSVSERIFRKLFPIRIKLFKKKFPLPIAYMFSFIRFFGTNNFDFSTIKYFPKRLPPGVSKEDLVNIDSIVATSDLTQLMVKDDYERDSITIYPPINIGNFKYKQNKNYWISINRIHPQKDIGMQIEAFKKLPNENLRIIGQVNDKEYYDNMNKILPKNVKFLGLLNEREIVKELSFCKGLIATSHDEALGMNVLEAMASGKPVIAPNEGGYRETVIDGVTGKLIKDINPNKLVLAIKQVGKNPKKYKNACIKQAKKFDTSIFIRKMKKVINETIENEKKV